jgi:hypothetical protein
LGALRRERYGLEADGELFLNYSDFKEDAGKGNAG